MEWRLFANLAEAAGTKRAEVEAGAGDTLGDAFEQLLETHPELEELVFDADGDLEEHVRILHEGEDPFAVAEGFDTVLGDGDEAALFPPVSGG